jgi:hypothetical protein
MRPHVFVDDADVLIGDSSITIDQQSHGHVGHMKALRDIRIADDDVVGDGMLDPLGASSRTRH